MAERQVNSLGGQMERTHRVVMQHSRVYTRSSVQETVWLGSVTLLAHESEFENAGSRIQVC